MPSEDCPFIRALLTCHLLHFQPYYILQFPYDKSGATVQSDPVTEENRRFVRSLSPSYLTFDYEGRVIRLDTFSKTIAPGSRLGW